MLNFPHSDAPQKRGALAIFCRAPRLGTVKTRIAQTRGEEFALGLYRAMLADTFALSRALAPKIETFACFTPKDGFEGDNPFAELWDGPHLAQCEGDLGARILDCFAQLRARGFEKIVVIGSDSPDLPLKRLQRAFEKLEHLPALLAPSPDGGFYLIGASENGREELLQNVRWSSSNTRIDITNNLKTYDPKLRRQIGSKFPLPAWRDVDDEDDLMELRRRIFELGTHAPHTRDFLANNRTGS
jgi:hypothetical protein